MRPFTYATTLSLLLALAPGGAAVAQQPAQPATPAEAGAFMARAEKQVIGFVALTETTAAVRTRDRLYDASGTLMAEWEHAYLMSDTPDGLKVAAALPDDEHRAWRERATPPSI